MGRGIDLAAIKNPEAAKAIEDMKDQLIIVLLKRLGGTAAIRCPELDDTADVNMAFSLVLEEQTFYFSVVPK